MDEPFPDLSDLVGLLQLASFSQLQLESLAKANTALTEQLKSLDPLRTAATFGALLTRPELMTNGTRLEVLAHLALANGKTTRKPNSKFIAKSFTAIGKGVCGQVEDPAEDAFVSLIRTPRGPFRIIEGIWDSAGFYLQRVMDAVEGMPTGGGYDDLRNRVYALLRLSDLACDRAGLVRYQAGAVMPAKRLPAEVIDDLETLRAAVRFTEEELGAAGIEIDDLAAFIFDPEHRQSLLAATIGHTELERFPVAHRDGEFFLVLPTAVSLAIRRYLIEEMDALGMRPAFLAGLAHEYAELFRSTPILGGAARAEIEFQRREAGYFAGVTTQIDRGRYLNLIFMTDSLDGFESDSFLGANPDPLSASETLDLYIDHAAQNAGADPEFLEGVTLIVGCGYGRAVTQALNNVERPNWRIEMVGAPDLCTLSWLQDFKPLSLWRILDARDELERHGVHLHNVNGLLNLVAWARTLRGHLVPHSDLPDDFADASGNAFIMINQNGVLEMREEVMRIWDPHMERAPDGDWVRVKREGISLFEEDATKPLFAREDRPVGVYVTPQRTWWSETETPKDVEGQIAYQRWKASSVWLARAAPVLERRIEGLPDGPILWRTIYAGDLSQVDQSNPPIGYEAAKNERHTSVDQEARLVMVNVTAAFEPAHVNVDNIAERALVAALVEGVAQLGGGTLSPASVEEIVDEIVAGPMARQLHAFTNPSLRDHVQASLPRKPVIIDQIDDATSRLGLGWKVREREAGNWINGKPDTTAFLNQLVAALEDELAEQLRQLDRRQFLEMVLRNHEAAAIDRDHWRRTTGAVVALHDDTAAARETIARYEFKLTAVFQMSRLLAEFALCECPLEGGRRAGALDLSRLMTTASDIFHMGGFSDAIRWDVMEPRIRVTALGDVHANWDFVDSIVEPFSLVAAEGRLDDAIKDYPKNLEEREAAPLLHSSFEPEFLKAFEEEVGASLDEVRTFVEFAEDIAVRANQAVVTLPRSSLFNVKTDAGELSEDVAKRLVERLTFRTRSRWRDTPPGYEDRDRFPWRFRRRLTIIRLPLLQIDDAADPTILFAAGIVRDAFVYMVSNYHHGSFPDYQLTPRMKAWAGKIADKRGRKFAEDVAERLKALGWETQVDVKITKLLGQGFDRDYGDVDVLAWNPGTGRVLICECKDVQYRKTYGEMAEQLSDFRGGLRANGKPDYLLLHLNRMDLISKHLPTLAQYVGLETLSLAESHLVFRNPVPMAFALERLKERVTISLFDALSTI